MSIRPVGLVIFHTYTSHNSVLPGHHDKGRPTSPKIYILGLFETLIIPTMYLSLTSMLDLDNDYCRPKP